MAHRGRKAKPLTGAGMMAEGADVTRLERGSLRELAGEYLELLRARAYSERTIATRAANLRAFALWCEQRAILRPVEVTRAVVEGYQRWLASQRTREGQTL